MKAFSKPDERFTNTQNAWDMEDHGSVLYVLGVDRNGPCKIGHTQNIGLRVSQLQVGCWLPLVVYGVRACFDRKNASPGGLYHSMLNGARGVESATHKALKECEVHLRGEWFDVTAEEALRAVEVAANKSGYGAISLEQVAGAELAPTASTIEVKTQQAITAGLMRVNNFVMKTIDKNEMNELSL